MEVRGGAKAAGLPHQNEKKYAHFCKKCKYFTKSPFSMQSHMKRHESQMAPFVCHESTPETFYCIDCNFETHLSTDFVKHIRQSLLNSKFREKKYCIRCSLEIVDEVTIWLIHSHCEPSLLDHSYCKSAFSNCRSSNAEGWKGAGLRTVMWFHCTICQYKNKREIGLQRHLFEVHARPIQGLRKLALYDHSYSKSNSGVSSMSDKIEGFRCNNCPYKSRSRFDLNLHQCGSCSQWFHCTKCAFRTTKPPLLCAHFILRHDKKGWFSCSECPFVTKGKLNLQRHYRDKHKFYCRMSADAEWLQCGACLYRTKSWPDLKSHRCRRAQRRAPDAPAQWFQCKKCPFQTTKPTNLRHHIILRHQQSEDQERASCPKCGLICRNKAFLEKHVFQSHTLSSDQYAPSKGLHCKDCPFRAITRSELRTHALLEHPKVKWFKCRFNGCSYKSDRKDELKRHVATAHMAPEGATMLHCGHCAFTTKFQHSIQTHIYMKHIMPNVEKVSAENSK